MIHDLPMPSTFDIDAARLVTRDAMAWIRKVSDKAFVLHVLPLDDESAPQVIKLPVAITGYKLWGAYRGAWIVSAIVLRPDSPDAEVAEVHAIEPDGRVRWTVETPWLNKPTTSDLFAGSRVHRGDLPERFPLPVQLTDVVVWLDLAQGRVVETGPNPGIGFVPYERGTIVTQRQRGLHGPVVLDAQGTPHGYRLEQVQQFNVSHVADDLWWVVLAADDHAAPGDLPWAAIDLVTGTIVARHADPLIEHSALAPLPH